MQYERNGLSRLRFAAAACSRRTGALSTLPEVNLAAYISSTNVFVITCDNHQVVAVLPAHSCSVTTVALHNPGNSDCILLFTAASDGTVTLWKGIAQPSASWCLLSSWIAHNGQPCVSLSVCNIAGNEAVVTAGMEGDLKLWVSSSEYKTWDCVAGASTEPFGTVLLECITMRSISATNAVIAVGGTDSRVLIYDVSLPCHEDMRLAGVLQGHRDWVRGLAFSEDVFVPRTPSSDSKEFYFASASRDGTARVWSVQKRAANDDDDEFSEHTARVTVELGGEQWAFTAVALLDEHTAAVHSVAFSGTSGVDADLATIPKLVTSSMDCTVGIWEVQQDERWICSARFGLMGGSSAHALGFFGASFSKRDGSEVLGHNFPGALHCWRVEEIEGKEEGGEDKGQQQYYARHAPGGHFAPVTDLVWEPQGRYLLSCSTDKTTRIYIEMEEEGERSIVEWARPQVHGHSIFAVAFCEGNGQRYVSGAEERMLRLFEAPQSFKLPGEAGHDMSLNISGKATAAVVPELGLSNKATFSSDQAHNESKESAVNGNDTEFVSFGAQRDSSAVPLEEDLKQRRLWPETAKLYGHGNEIACVAVDLKNLVLASSCRAQAKKDATIILWDIKSGTEGGRLSCHDLTVNQISFSTDGKQLLSASRDRSFAVFTKTTDNKFSFALSVQKRNAHSRLLNACGWILDDKFVVTGSRDKCMKVFSIADEDTSEVFKEKFSSSVTALSTAFSQLRPQNCTTVAAGFEDGAIRILSAELDEKLHLSVTRLFETTAESRCGLRVNSLQWRPRSEDQKKDKMELAVASDDWSVRIIDFLMRPPQGT